MYKYKVYVNEEFVDKYNDKLYSIGSVIEELSEERVNEIMAVSKSLISIISKELVKSDTEIEKEKALEIMRKELEELKASMAKENKAKTKDQNVEK